MKEILIETLMTKGVRSISPNTRLADVLEIMRDNNYSCTVIAEADETVGIITERDIVRMLAGMENGRDVLAVKVSEVMTSPVITINEKDSLFEALVISKAQGIRHLPVVNSQGRLTGIVTQSDLVKIYFQVFEKQREIIEKSINERTEALIRANEELKMISMEDPLLGIGNRRAMEVDLQHTHASAIRYKHPYSVILLDLDYFKSYNDHYGHLAGDEALKGVSKVLKANIRGADRLYRYGGEEFLVLLPQISIDGAKIAAAKMIEKVKDANFLHCKSPCQIITISAGACSFSCDDGVTSWKDMIKRADVRLYKAKEGGRNRVVSED